RALELEQRGESRRVVGGRSVALEGRQDIQLVGCKLGQTQSSLIVQSKNCPRVPLRQDLLEEVQRFGAVASYPMSESEICQDRLLKFACHEHPRGWNSKPLQSVQRGFEFTRGSCGIPGSESEDRVVVCPHDPVKIRAAASGGRY